MPIRPVAIEFMRKISRRKFCIFAGVAGAGVVAQNLLTQQRAFGQMSRRDVPDVAAIDRRRILKAADQYLREEPVTVTAFSSPRSTGGKNDYFSEGDYWWPDPKNPAGPYVQRDGMTNPDNFNAHRHALIRLSVQVPALAAAWMHTRKNSYASHAAKHLRAWFLDPATRMRSEPSVRASHSWGEHGARYRHH